MGNCSGGPADPANDVSRDIDKALKKEPKRYKVLLLGAGDSGKSTYMKQMTLFYLQNFSELELNKIALGVRAATVAGFKVLCAEVITEKLESDTLQKSIRWAQQQIDETHADWPTHITKLWAHPEFKKVYEQRNQLGLQLDCNLKYFLDHCTRVLAHDFVPTTEDALAVRTKTTGVHERKFPIEKENIEIEFVDVGGQRAERRKWINQFEKVDLVIYFSALDNYALQMNECEGNRLDDDLRLFSSLMILIQQKSSWCFFFTKVDIFESVLKQVPINERFKEIPKEKAQSVEHCTDFLQTQFKNKWDGDKNAIKFYTICSLDTNQLKTVWGAIKQDMVNKVVNTYL